MTRTILSASIAVALSAAAISTADAGARCPNWSCSSNGTQLTGVMPQFPGSPGLLLTAVILPSGEAIEPTPQTLLAEARQPILLPKPPVSQDKQLESKDRTDNFEIQR